MDLLDPLMCFQKFSEAICVLELNIYLVFITLIHSIDMHYVNTLLYLNIYNVFIYLSYCIHF